MKKVLCFLCAFALCFVCICSLPTAFAQEKEYQGNAEDTFAYRFVTEFVTEYPDRTFDGENAPLVAEYLASRFRDLGFAPEKVEKQSVYVERQNRSAFNVVATIDNPSTTQRIIIGAHFDSVGNGTGVTDNACGVATLLVVAQKLLAVGSFDFDVTFVAFTGEENGMYGSYEFVQNMEESDIDDVLCYVNIDSICAGDNLYVCGETVETPLENLFASKSDKVNIKPYGVGLFPFNQYGYGYYEMAQNTDLTPFRLSGIPTIGFFAGNYVSDLYVESVDVENIVMNTTLDTLDNFVNHAERYVDRIYTVANCVASTVMDGSFVATVSDARNHLVSPVWYMGGIAKLFAILLAVLAVVGCVIYYKKLSKTAILGVAEAKEKTGVFTCPDAEDIFTFRSGK